MSKIPFIWCTQFVDNFLLVDQLVIRLVIVPMNAIIIHWSVWLWKYILLKILILCMYKNWQNLQFNFCRLAEHLRIYRNQFISVRQKRDTKICIKQSINIQRFANSLNLFYNSNESIDIIWCENGIFGIWSNKSNRWHLK